MANIHQGSVNKGNRIGVTIKVFLMVVENYTESNVVRNFCPGTFQKRTRQFSLPSKVGHSLILKMSDRSFFEQKMSDFENRSFIAHFRVIALFVALFERAKERLLSWLLF